MYDRIKKDMISAMKNKDKMRLTVIRMVKAAIDKERIDRKVEITDEIVIDVLAKQEKMRIDAKNEFIKANRLDLVDDTLKEIEILKEYLPEPLTIDEVNTIIDSAIKELDATTLKDIGKVMGVVTPKLKGRTDMKNVSTMIRNKLN